MSMQQDLMEVVYEPPLSGIIAELADMAALSSMRAPLQKAVRDVIIPAISRHFDDQPGWPPLADATVLNRERYGFGGESMLVRTGKLRQTATQENIWNVGPDSAEIDSGEFIGRVPYGAIQNFGGFTSGAHGTFIPARPFFFMEETEEDGIEMVFVEYMAMRLFAHGFTIGSIFQ